MNNKNSAEAIYKYHSEIYFSQKGMKKKVIFAIDGYAGQQMIFSIIKKPPEILFRGF
tara:strand:+ start:301 stop:471 length:171 start_codon:yes stop_codon:yes gene_type:complete